MPNRSLLRSAVRTSSRLALALGLALTISSCAETATCPSGTAHRPTGEGTWSSECVPLADASIDAPPDVDAHVADGGPCRVGCSGETPLCRTSDMTCVECLGDEDCADNDGGPLCDTTAGRCVACLGDTDCNDPATARCGPEGTCVSCTDSDQCGHIVGSGVCASGTCVECSDADLTACGGNACRSDHHCSAYGLEVQDDCEPCDTDTNCEADHYCVPMQFDGEDRPGGYCLGDFAMGCTQPFGIRITDRTTLSGASDLEFCGINEDLTTCEAVRALVDNWVCSGTDGRCAPAVGMPEVEVLGALCRRVGGLLDHCTYQCEGAVQCASFAPGNTCGEGTASDPPSYCGGG